MAAVEYTVGDYKRLSERIRNNPQNIELEDLNMLQSLRVTYKEPLATIFHTVEKMAHRIDKNSICTYRVKRIESIVSKLIRFPKMQVQRMEDIAGCRCIMTSLEHVYKLYESIQRSIDTLPFEIRGKIQNYIEQPKQSGYRSIHLNVVLRGDDRNRRIEIQIRCLDQHNWATLVEITDLLYKSRLKEMGPKDAPDLFDFHFLLSKADDELTFEEKNRLADIAQKYGYIKRISTIFSKNYIDVRRTWNEMRLKKMSFFLIATDSKGLPEFDGFHFFEEAENAYFTSYTKNEENRNIVLTHLQNPSFEKISIAYSNYVLTYNNTLNRILKFLTDAIVNTYNKNHLHNFRSYYQSFQGIINCWLDNKMLEVESLNVDSGAKKSLKKKKEWVNSIVYDVNDINKIMADMHRALKFKPQNAILYFAKKRMDRSFKKKLRAEQMKHNEQV